MVLILSDMDNQEILNEFGRLVISEAYDNHIALVKNNLEDLRKTERFKNLFKEMTPIQKKELETLSEEILSGLLFDFLRIFEEHQNFKIVYEAGNKAVNLVKLSEMFKAELIIEGGWIDRFSQFK
jgi:hypothetical protein